MFVVARLVLSDYLRGGTQTYEKLNSSSHPEFILAHDIAEIDVVPRKCHPVNLISAQEVLGVGDYKHTQPPHSQRMSAAAVSEIEISKKPHFSSGAKLRCNDDGCIDEDAVGRTLHLGGD